MKFLICLALCIAAAQAGYIASPLTYAAAPVYGAHTYAAPAVAATYGAPVTTYSAGLPAAYSAYAAPAYAPSVYSAHAYTAPVATYAAQAIAPVTTYGAPVATYAAPAVISPFLKKK